MPVVPDNKYGSFVSAFTHQIPKTEKSNNLDDEVRESLYRKTKTGGGQRSQVSLKSNSVVFESSSHIDRL